MAAGRLVLMTVGVLSPWAGPAGGSLAGCGGGVTRRATADGRFAGSGVWGVCMERPTVRSHSSAIVPDSVTKGVRLPATHRPAPFPFMGPALRNGPGETGLPKRVGD